MARPLVLVKLGGSLLTHKARGGPPRYRSPDAHRLLRELAAGLRRSRSRAILVHGAGSFGHPLALRRRVGRRRFGADAAARIFTEIQSSVALLRTLLLGSCRRSKLAAVGIPASLVARSGTRGVSLDSIWFKVLVDHDLLAVTGGDVVLDGHFGVRVLGGDELLWHLARALRPRRVVIATDVDGVVLRRALLLDLPARAVARAAHKISRGRDATGGMRGKVEFAGRIARLGIPVHIVNGRVPGRLRDAVAGRHTWGTTISP